MRILVTGCEGQLGKAVVDELRCRGHWVTGTGHRDMDITDRVSVERVFEVVKPEAVIHCAAYTNVDRAEEEENLCREVNVQGTSYVLACCRACQARMIFISSDYVFSGEAKESYKEIAPREPINVYGKSKRDGENLVSTYEKTFIVRTSWVFGEGKNFVTAILARSERDSALHVVSDQIGCPTYAKDLAILLADMIVTDRYGIYHVTNEGACTWYEFAKEIIKQTGKTTEVLPVTTEEYPVKARRPHNSRLGKENLDEAGFSRLPDWEDALKRYIDNTGR